MKPLSVNTTPISPESRVTQEPLGDHHITGIRRVSFLCLVWAVTTPPTRDRKEGQEHGRQKVQYRGGALDANTT